MTTRTLILCAGDGERWGGYLGIPKQLITVGGESLLGRATRLLRQANLTDIVIVSHDERLRLDGCGFFTPARRRWVVETLLMTRQLWEARTIILLGDVFYTARAMRQIIAYEGPIGIFGRRTGNLYTGGPWPELFALSFDRASADTVAHHAEIALHHALAGGLGKLWSLYRSFAGLPLDSLAVERRLLCHIHDLTDDFDSPADYDRAIRRYRWLMSRNPLKRAAMLVWVWALGFVKYIDHQPLLRRAVGKLRLWLRQARSAMNSGGAS